MTAKRDWLTKITPSRDQTVTSLPFRIASINDLTASGYAQRVLDAGNDHFIAISNEVCDITYDSNRYTLLAGLYGPSGRQVQRYANVCYTAGSRTIAESVCATISVLRSQQLARLRQPVRLAWDTDTASIWITEEKSRVPDVVGETRTTNVTYFDVTSQKDTNEFARVIAHEWGHLALHAARGFTAPEPDSAGHVGEALGLQWLAGTATKGNITPVLPSPGFVVASRNRFDKALRAAPPGSAGFVKRSAQGMYAYIGSILHVADTYGDTFLGRVFQAVDADSQDAFLTAWAFVLTEDGVIRFHGTAWVPLEAGVYQASHRIQPASIKGPAGITCDSRLRLTVRRSGWYQLTAPQRDDLILRRKGR